MSTENNIVQLQRLFDKYIYSSYDEEVLSKYAEEELEELANNILTRKFLVNTLTWQNIYEFFPNKEDFFSNLRTYAKTIIQLKEASNISTHLLLCSCSNTNDGVSITHTAIGLKLYLYRRSNASIYNNSINITFL